MINMIPMDTKIILLFTLILIS